MRGKIRNLVDDLNIYLDDVDDPVNSWPLDGKSTFDRMVAKYAAKYLLDRLKKSPMKTDQRAALIVEHTYGLNGVKPKKAVDIAKIVGIRASHVAVIRNWCIMFMINKIESDSIKAGMDAGTIDDEGYTIEQDAPIRILMMNELDAADAKALSRSVLARF